MTGYIRITNKRKGKGPKPEPGETVLDGDRSHPLLGNRHILHNPRDPDERARVIEAYRLDLEADWASQGPMCRAIQELADRVLANERIALQCWCAPLPCHLEHVLAKVRDVVRQRQPDHPFGQSNSESPPSQGQLF